MRDKVLILFFDSCINDIVHIMSNATANMTVLSPGETINGSENEEANLIQVHYAAWCFESGLAFMW